MKNLKIYSASAGAGKTFKLTQEYIGLLFDDPYRYKNILAVTFTNKATEEMKTRILKVLQDLAKSAVDEMKNNPYAAALHEEKNMDYATIHQKSKRILSGILHDYSRFTVNTIDKFYQKVLRAFIKEIGIQPNFVLELDDKDVLGKAVDEMIQQLESDDPLKEWLIDFSFERMDEGKNWSLERDLKTFGKEIFKEEFKLFPQEQRTSLEDAKKLKQVKSLLKKQMTAFEKEMQKKAGELIATINKQGYSVEDFSHKKNGVYGQIEKIATQKAHLIYKDGGPFAKSRMQEAIESPEKWLSKSNKDSGLQQLISSTLHPKLLEMRAFFENQHSTYQTSRAFHENINVLGVLSRIRKEVLRYCEENNIFLNSDTGTLIHAIIGDNETPFIYEKLGHIFKNFLIDEFQDTSRIQWNNFKPLLQNSIAENNKSILVGDVKQSIYRWRNSDWLILSEEAEQTVPENMVEKIALDSNWRSKEQIVAFNNSMMATLVPQLEEVLLAVCDQDKEKHAELIHHFRNAYSAAFQKMPMEKPGGYIRHQFIETKKNEGLKAKEQILNELPDQIQKILNRGIKQKDIAILVRSNKEGQEIAGALLEAKAEKGYKYEFISNDSLFINESYAVKLIIAALRLLQDDTDLLAKTELRTQYVLYLNKEQQVHHEMHVYFDKEEADQYLPATFFEKFNTLKLLSLSDLVEQIIAIFFLNEHKEEVPFILALQDIIQKQQEKSSPSIYEFLKWWEEAGNNQTLKASDTQDAIRIATIHKMKGLEYEAILIPFCDWKIVDDGQKAPMMWTGVQIQEAEFNGQIPITFKKELLQSHLKETYLNELMHQLVDNLNLIYVAFTRAKSFLYIYSEKPTGKNDKEVKHINQLLYNAYQQKNRPEISEDYPALRLNEHFDAENAVFEVGNPAYDKTKDKAEAFPEFPDYQWHDPFSKIYLKRNVNDYRSMKDQDYESPLDYGKLMHLVFSRIKDMHDAENVINALSLQGHINKKEKQELQEKINEAFRQEGIEEWFDSKGTVLNERDLILPGGDIYRPDRVVLKKERTLIIDYKFGEKEEQGHLKQVDRYATILRKMGYKGLEGYLWYINKKKIQKVELTS